MTVPGPTARPRGGVAPPATRTDRTRRAALLRRRRWTVGIVCAGLLLVVGVWVAAVAGHDPGPPAARPPARTTVTPRYTNPVIDHDFPDPDVVHTGSTYVALSTGTGGLDVPMETSTDLVHWRSRGDVLPALPSWAVHSWQYVWAPDLVPVRGGWVLWFAAKDARSGRQCIGVASSPSASGPFRSTSDEPTICQTSLGGSIDPFEFVDSHGHRWLLWKNDGNCCGVLSQIWSQPLAADGVALTGTATPILSYDGGWEDGGPPDESTIEGPDMIEVDGAYHLFFSGGGYATAGYAVGHARCTSPVGPCQTTSPYPVLASFGTVAGPGGESIFRGGGGTLWMAYAAWTQPEVGPGSGGARSMRIDRLTFIGALPVVSGPTTTPVSLVGS